MNQYDGTEDSELETHFDGLYRQIMAGFDSLPLATWTPEYRAAMRAIQTQEIQLRAIGTELARRLTERTARRDGTTEAMIRFSYGCPCGGALNWNDDTTLATCEICGVVHDGIKDLTVVPDE